MRYMPLSQKQNNLFKRQNYHKQIRRQTLEYQFKKIRHQLTRQIYEQGILVERAHKTIQMISNLDYYILKLPPDIIKHLNQSVQSITALSLQDLEYDLPFVKSINQQWELIAKWEYHTKQTIDSILRNIMSSICPIIFQEAVINFLLELMSLLIMADKIKIIKEKYSAFKKIYLVGKEQQTFMEGTVSLCYHCLINITGSEYDQLVMPFLSWMSEVCKKHVKYVQIYINFFLTNNLDFDLKIKLFQDYLFVINFNREDFLNNFQMSIDILHVIFEKQPHIKIKQNYSSLTSKAIVFLDELILNKTQLFCSQELNKSKFERGECVPKLFKIIQAVVKISPQYICSSENILIYLINKLQLSQDQNRMIQLHLSLQIFCLFGQDINTLNQIFIRRPLYWTKLVRLVIPFATQVDLKHQGQKKYVYKGTNLQQEILFNLLYILEQIASSQTHAIQLINQNKMLQNVLNIYYNHSRNSKKNKIIQTQCAAIFFLCFLKQEKQNHAQLLFDLIYKNGLQMLIQETKSKKIAQDYALKSWTKLFNLYFQNEEHQTLKRIINYAISSRHFRQILTNLRDTEENPQKFNQICIILDFCQKIGRYY